MVLHHIANRPRFFIVGSTTLNANVFSNCDLDMIDITPVPDWLEDTICQTEDQDILYRLFAKIVVDAVDLFLFKDFAYLTVQFTS
jgi:hypothetical protein